MSINAAEDIPAGRHVIEFRSIDTEERITVNSQPFSIRIENSLGIVDESKLNGAFPYLVFNNDSPIVVEEFKFSLN